MKNTIITIFGLLLLLGACKEEDCCDASNPDCSNFDPCYGVEETSADFYIYENLGAAAPLGWENVDTDTLRSWVKGATFTAKEDADKYTWYIGSEEIDTKSFSRSSFPEDVNIEVTLIVENFNPDTLCYPNDDGKDTLTRVFNTGELNRAMKWEGTFEGRYEFSPDETHQFTLGEDSVWTNGIPYNNCAKSEFVIIDRTYNSLQFIQRDLFDQTDRCQYNYRANFFVDNNNEFVLTIVESQDESMNGQTMTGTKID